LEEASLLVAEESSLIEEGSLLIEEESLLLAGARNRRLRDEQFKRWQSKNGRGGPGEPKNTGRKGQEKKPEKEEKKNGREGPGQPNRGRKGQGEKPEKEGNKRTEEEIAQIEQDRRDRIKAFMKETYDNRWKHDNDHIRDHQEIQAPQYWLVQGDDPESYRLWRVPYKWEVAMPQEKRVVFVSTRNSSNLVEKALSQHVQETSINFALTFWPKATGNSKKATGDSGEATGNSKEVPSRCVGVTVQVQEAQEWRNHYSPNAPASAPLTYLHELLRLPKYIDKYKGGLWVQRGVYRMSESQCPKHKEATGLSSWELLENKTDPCKVCLLDNLRKSPTWTSVHKNEQKIIPDWLQTEEGKHHWLWNSPVRLYHKKDRGHVLLHEKDGDLLHTKPISMMFRKHTMQIIQGPLENTYFTEQAWMRVWFKYLQEFQEQKRREGGELVIKVKYCQGNMYPKEPVYWYFQTFSSDSAPYEWKTLLYMPCTGIQTHGLCISQDPIQEIPEEAGKDRIKFYYACWCRDLMVKDEGAGHDGAMLTGPEWLYGLPWDDINKLKDQKQREDIEKLKDQTPVYNDRYAEAQLVFEESGYSQLNPREAVQVLQSNFFTKRKMSTGQRLETLEMYPISSQESCSDGESDGEGIGEA
jgi:hypothetical protein